MAAAANDMRMVLISCSSSVFGGKAVGDTPNRRECTLERTFRKRRERLQAAQANGKTPADLRHHCANLWILNSPPIGADQSAIGEGDASALFGSSRMAAPAFDQRAFRRQ
jgi:hypothetical protein